MSLIRGGTLAPKLLLNEAGLTLDDLLVLFAEMLPADVDTCVGIIQNARDMNLPGCETSMKFSDLSKIFLQIRDDEKGVPSPNAERALAIIKSRIAERQSLTCFDSNTPQSSSGRVLTPGESSMSLAWNRMPFLPGKTIDGYRMRIFLTLEYPGQSMLGKFMSFFMMLVILVSTVAFVMESMPSFRVRPAECQRLLDAGLPLTVQACEPVPLDSFYIVETICILIFTVEYFARLFTVHASPGTISDGPFWRTLRYALRFLNVVDVLAVFPYYLDLVIWAAASGGSVGMVAVLRLTRVLRLLKVAKHNPGIRMVAEVLKMSGQPLLILMFFNGILTVLFGALIYFAEGQFFSVDSEFTKSGFDTCTNSSVAAPFPTGVFVRRDQSDTGYEITPFRSIPLAMWWASVTMTTVGYGEFSPTTPMGKIIGVICFYVGIVFLGLPIQVLSTNFEDVYGRQQAAQEIISPKRLRRKGTSRISSNKGGWIPRVPGLRRKIFNLLEDPQCCRLSKAVSLFMMLLIAASTTTFVMESMPSFQRTPSICLVDMPSVDSCTPVPYPFFYSFEAACVAVFTADYVTRVATAHAATPNECDLDERRVADSKCKQTVLYVLQVLNLVDLFAILPWYVEKAGAGGTGASVLRVLRLIRVFRMLKAPRLRKLVDMFVDVVQDATPALVIMFLLSSLMCIFFSSLVMFAEGTNYSVTLFTDEYPYGVYVRPSKEGYDMTVSPFTSILYAFWWFFVTATTVGYGDDYPTTAVGRIVGIMAFYTGIVLLALPVTILGGSFGKYYPRWIQECKEASRSPSSPSSPTSPSLAAWSPIGAGGASEDVATPPSTRKTEKPEAPAWTDKDAASALLRMSIATANSRSGPITMAGEKEGVPLPGILAGEKEAEESP